ncbi:hypothetical protein WICPIJ_005209 [Wickerhamomyces pijperi]|uniref:Bromo domain-containing protein n=1 Tax=Wickerhamomyces pijperi TaxID=599730 RepID=A0A9P8Q664_WICPI|nr:hypothetical protein WICPIJ_005209 [Wickerhamomyces pijperi]
MSTTDPKPSHFSDLSSFDMIVLGVIGSLIGDTKSSPMSLSEICNIINKHPLVALVRQNIDYSTASSSSKAAEIRDVIRSIKVLFKGTLAITINENNKDHFDFLMTRESFQEFVKEIEMEYREDMLSDIKGFETQYFEKIQRIEQIEKGELDNSLIDDYQKKRMKSPPAKIGDAKKAQSAALFDHQGVPDTPTTLAIARQSATPELKLQHTSNPMVLTPIKSKPGNIAQTLASNRLASSQRASSASASASVISPSTAPLTPVKLAQLPKHDIKPYPNAKATISPPKSNSPVLPTANVSIPRPVQPSASKSQSTSRKTSVTQVATNADAGDARLNPTPTLPSRNPSVTSTTPATNIKPITTEQQIPATSKASNSTLPSTPVITNPATAIKEQPEPSPSQETPSKSTATAQPIPIPTTISSQSASQIPGSLNIAPQTPVVATAQAINPFYPANNQAQVKAASLAAANSGSGLNIKPLVKPSGALPDISSLKQPSMDSESQEDNTGSSEIVSSSVDSSSVNIGVVDSAASIASRLKRSYDNSIADDESAAGDASVVSEPVSKKIKTSEVAESENNSEVPDVKKDKELDVSMKDNEGSQEKFEDAQESLEAPQGEGEEGEGAKEEAKKLEEPVFRISSNETKDNQETQEEETSDIEMKDAETKPIEPPATTEQPEDVSAPLNNPEVKLNSEEALNDNDTDEEQKQEEQEEKEKEEEGPEPSKKQPEQSKTQSLSRETSSYTTQNKKLNALAQNLLDTLSSHRFATPFLQPVGNSIADYSAIVKESRDFKTLKQMVKDGRIQTKDELKRDILLMFANAVMFNQSETEVAEWAKVLTEENTKVWELFEDSLKD